MCLNQSDMNRRQTISEGLNKIQSCREKANGLSQIEIDFLKRKIQFASEFKLYDELTWRKEVMQTELIRKSNQERVEAFEMTSQPQFESFERNMDGPGQLTLMPGKIS